MKQKTFFRELLRSIFRSKARFFSIASIIAIGVGFFAGINATKPNMIMSAHTYYENMNLADIRIMSPLGFEDKDMDAIGEVSDVRAYEEGYWKDLFLVSDEGYTSIVRLYSHDSEKNEMNKINLVEGRLPEKSGEIVIQAGGNVPLEIKVGSEVTFQVASEEELTDTLVEDSFTVVGTMTSPIYISYERGQTTIGDGSIDFYAYVYEDAFQLEKANHIYARTSDAEELIAYTEEYEEHLASVQASIEEVGKVSIEREVASLKQELQEGKEELVEKKQEAEEELAKAEEELLSLEEEIAEADKRLEEKEAEFLKEIEVSRTEIESGERELNKARNTYEEQRKQWEASNKTFEQAKKELGEKSEELKKTDVQFTDAEEELAAKKKLLDEKEVELETLNNMIDRYQQKEGEQPPHLLAQYESGLASLIDGLQQYEASKSILEAKRAEYVEGRAQYEIGVAELAAAEIKLTDGERALNKGKAQLDQKTRELQAAKKALNEGEADLYRELEQGQEELANGKEELSEGWLLFQEEKEGISQDIAEADEEIERVEEQIEQIPESWLVETRDGNPGYSRYKEDADRIGAVAQVFPLFFFLVAGLVSLTTMTRMIEEERTQIGTLKALGYSPVTIASKYLLYAFSASLLGAILGLLVGFQLFPTAIMNAYEMMYTIPERVTPFHWDYAIISTVLALVTTVLTTYFATIKELKSSPATLMHPRAPKPGKQIFLEKIPAFWSKLSFTSKVTFRNLFRYKGRFYMTIFGISGCTALLVAGFGLSDSVNDVMGKQNHEILLNHGQIILDVDTTEANMSIQEKMENHEDIASYLAVNNEAVEVISVYSDVTFEATMVVPSDRERLNEAILIQDRLKQEEFPLPAEGVIMTEKLASLLDVDSGDAFTYRDNKNRQIEMEVAAITENYLSHYMYVSKDYWESVTGKDYSFNAFMFQVEDLDRIDKSDFLEGFMNDEAVMAAYFNLDIAKKYEDTMKSLDSVVFILIISAGVLAFVVLYNLTNINITERLREIATLKVLGFRNKEVDAYVYRENFFLIFFGTMFGLILGNVLHHYVIITMEIDTMMFGREIHFSSYVWSIALTLIFTTSVNFFMHYKLKNIHMVESLKSVE